MQPITSDDLNCYYKWQFSEANVDFANNLIDEVNKKLNTIPERYRKSIDRLAFAICDNEYINNNFDYIAPRNKKDGMIKLHAYTSHHLLNGKILGKFYEYKNTKGFDYYGAVHIGKSYYNALQTFIREFITMEEDNQLKSKVEITDKFIKNFKMLIQLVNLSEIDSAGHDSLYYIHNCKKSEKLIEEISNDYNIRDIINQIQKSYNMKKLETRTLSFDEKYHYDLVALPAYLKLTKYNHLSDRFDIKIYPNESKINLIRK